VASRFICAFACGALLSFVAAGCSDDSGGTADAKTLVDQALLPDTGAPDLPALPDMPELPDTGGAKCEFEWLNAISPQKKVSTGAVSTTDIGNGVKETSIDASAGGTSLELQNPFVYISLKDGSKVDLDDIAARTSTSWDVAFRRSVIRVNGGDSGDGSCEVAIVTGTTLDQVTTVPAASEFTTDDFLDENCVIQTNDAGYLVTAFGGTTGRWYDFDTTNMKLVPNPDVYVVKTNDGTYVKLEIKDYYDTSTPPQGGHFTIQWSVLQ
jgi:hypothetical protein